MIDTKIIVALDYADMAKAHELINQLDPERCKLKVGKEMFTRFGPSFVQKLVKNGFKVFLDLKFHDIPNTVRKSCEAACDLGVWMVNVHALGGAEMIRAARRGIGNSTDRPLLTAVTILTSHDQNSLAEIGLGGDIPAEVRRLGRLACENGADGVVCSAHEVEVIRETTSQEFLAVTPGIRLLTDSPADQKRIMTPKSAIIKGANYLVIGRSISESAEPMSVIQEIEKEISFSYI
jgi:orotidine-5'-phosphate decarboxylase